MAKRIEVSLNDGTQDVYESTIFTGYRRRDSENGFCITKQSLFGDEQTIACYRNSQVSRTEQERCEICEAINPTQRA
jgi:hypothetical protein